MSVPSIIREEYDPNKPQPDLTYAGAWDRFTRLQNGINTDIRWLVSIPFGGGTVLFLLLYALTPKKYEGYDILVAFAAVIAGYVYLFVASFEWLFWSCPRCHHRWPGWSKKESCCEFCGLRLFQDAP
jgi:hypothetical protein